MPQATRFLYNTPQRSNTTSNWSGIGTRPALQRPIPKPRTGMAEANSSVDSAIERKRGERPPLVPPRHNSGPAQSNISHAVEAGNSSSTQEGLYKTFNPETLTTGGNDYTFLDPTSIGPPARTDRTTPTALMGEYQMLTPETISATTQYTQIQRNKGATNANDYEDIDPRATNIRKGSTEESKVGISASGKQASVASKRPNSARNPFMDKEELLENILVDDEFSGCDIEICRFSLEQQGYDVDKAKEEIRVQILLGMLLPNIREEDCRRALVHCQHKTNRAAIWLLQKSEEIQRREQ